MIYKLFYSSILSSLFNDSLFRLCIFFSSLFCNICNIQCNSLTGFRSRDVTVPKSSLLPYFSRVIWFKWWTYTVLFLRCLFFVLISLTDVKVISRVLLRLLNSMIVPLHFFPFFKIFIISVILTGLDSVLSHNGRRNSVETGTLKSSIY